jgi:hypothetical protein
VSRRHVGIVIVLVGIVAALIAALAEPLGIGEEGFGWKQAALLVIGIVLIVGGAVMTTLRFPRSGTGVPPPDRR